MRLITSLLPLLIELFMPSHGLQIDEASSWLLMLTPTVVKNAIVASCATMIAILSPWAILWCEFSQVIIWRLLFLHLKHAAGVHNACCNFIVFKMTILRNRRPTCHTTLDIHPVLFHLTSCEDNLALLKVMNRRCCKRRFLILHRCLKDHTLTLNMCYHDSAVLRRSLFELFSSCVKPLRMSLIPFKMRLMWGILQFGFKHCTMLGMLMHLPDLTALITVPRSRHGSPTTWTTKGVTTPGQPFWLTIFTNGNSRSGRFGKIESCMECHLNFI